MNEVALMDTNRMGNVEELMKILLVANMLNEQQQIGILMNHIAETERNHAAVMQELADIKEQLNELLSRSANIPNMSKSEENLSNIAEQTENTVKEQSHKLQNLKQDLNQKAHRVVENFKNTGIKALSGVCGFLGIQEKLTAMRDQARSAETDMKVAVEKINAVEKEMTEAASHLRNAGRIVSGRERNISEKPANDQTDSKRSSLFRRLRNHYEKRQNVYGKRAELLSKSIEKCRTLEQKASVLRKLSENQKKVEANAKDAANERPNLTFEHKRDENVR